MQLSKCVGAAATALGWKMTVNDGARNWTLESLYKNAIENESDPILENNLNVKSDWTLQENGIFRVDREKVESYGYQFVNESDDSRG
jgi:hypothetical protein